MLFIILKSADDLSWSFSTYSFIYYDAVDSNTFYFLILICDCIIYSSYIAGNFPTNVNRVKLASVQ